MTVRYALTAMTLALTSLPAVAGDAASRPLPIVNVGATPHLAVTCGEASLPSLREISAVLDTNNAGQLYAERERLLHTASRECARGFKAIVFVRDPRNTSPVLVMADLPTR